MVEKTTGSSTSVRGVATSVSARTSTVCGCGADNQKVTLPLAAAGRRASRAEHERVVGAFRAAAESGDGAALLALLDPDAAYTTDGGGKTFAARKVIAGAERIATVLVRVTAKLGITLAPVEVNGAPGLLVYSFGRLIGVDAFEVADGRVTAIRRVLNPDKLAGLRHAPESRHAEGPRPGRGPSR